MAMLKGSMYLIEKSLGRFKRNRRNKCNITKGRKHERTKERSYSDRRRERESRSNEKMN